MVRELDGIRILGPSDGAVREGSGSTVREIVSRADTGDRWRFGEVTAEPDDAEVGTHYHPGEPEVIVILQGPVELHGRISMIEVQAGDVVFIPPDTEHGIRTPTGGRWLAVWPVGERVSVRNGPRCR
jgi:quercetin dioxygenase-like cupin family protein